MAQNQEAGNIVMTANVMGEFLVQANWRQERREGGLLVQLEVMGSVLV